ncbi:zinc finger protein ZOP1-like isoform X2 [Aristolochia californica]|uniref:zinc finger protein ZOP1-like isoform X2 n=1 Tax=Aristolochia californica TaxID=171875 RepID=UPI0035DFD36F
MTEYWVSQGKKWCDFCKIYIANNALSIRTHELGQRHKDSVAKRLATMRKESAAKEKEQKEAARAFEQIEAKAKRSYQKDLATFGEMKDLNASASGPVQDIPETSQRKRPTTKPTTTGDTHAAKPTSAPPPGRVVSTPANPSRYIKGAPSSIAVSKRKRVAEKPKASSKEEEAALKAREAARKRVEEREAPLLGLYRSY